MPKSIRLTWLVLVVAVVGWASPAGAGGDTGPKDPCRDAAHHVLRAGWVGPLQWWFRARSTPDGIRRADAEAAFRRAAANIVNGFNDCGLPDNIQAANRYMGRTRVHMDVTRSSTCGQPDGRSVVGFGVLAPTDLALTCWWTRNGHMVEADIKLNTASFRWAPEARPGCVSEWSIVAVATHEFGHAFGLAHVHGSANEELTMSPLVAPCQDSTASLGLGDIRGLEAKY